jgi:hypothetical protein
VTRWLMETTLSNRGGCDRLACDDVDQRRSDVLAHPTLNGIAFVEVDPSDHRQLRIHFLKAVPPDGYGLVTTPSLAEIGGGVRIFGINAIAATVTAPDTVELTTDKPGDQSIYTLRLSHQELDPPLSGVEFSFVATCPTPVDCAVEQDCPPAVPDDPLIDYLAKDYASLRRMLLDFAATRHHQGGGATGTAGAFTDANPADLALTLLETLAYTGDQLSYFQDAVATEAYLDTARLRRSVRRHARLVDYRMHEGRNAYTFVALATQDTGTVGTGTPILSRITRPLPGTLDPPSVVLPPSLVDPATPDDFEHTAATAGVQVFETAHDVVCSPRNNELQIHTWGNDDCTLGTGTREAWLFSVSANGVAIRPVLHVGDYLLLEEVRGRVTAGLPQDADPARSVVVQIDDDPEDTTDQLYARQLVAAVDPNTGISQWELQRWNAGADLPLLHVRWRRADALKTPLCLSNTSPDGRRLRGISVARGNIVVADHGRTVQEAVAPFAPGHRPVELRLARGPLTHQAPAADPRYDAQGRMVAERTDLSDPPRACVPAVSVLVTTAGGTDRYVAVPDLLDSTPFDRNVVAEPGATLAAPGDGLVNLSGDVPSVDDGGVAGGFVVRFGDGVYGADPAASSGGVQYLATYRVGNGLSGNLGADALAHIALPTPPPAGVPTVTRVRNPLPVTTGRAPETLDEVRLNAPVAFAADQHRAVTEKDYADAATRLASVQSAVAALRCTGSWLTVYVGVDPIDPSDVVDLADGRSSLEPGFERAVLAHLHKFRQTGYDLELRAPQYVPVELALTLCVNHGHFRGEVEQAVRIALGASYQPSGMPAFFNQVNWTFGRPLRLSAIYAAVEAVPGVDSVIVEVFRRLGQTDNGELHRGVLELGTWEIARCDNDPNFAEHGTLTIASHGGKG